jgi:hypothetical protein
VTGAIAGPDAQARHGNKQTGAGQQTHLDQVAAAQAGGDDLAPVVSGLLLLFLRPSINLRNVCHCVFSFSNRHTEAQKAQGN